MIRNYLTVCLCVIFACCVSFIAAGEAIVGGKKARAGAFPYQVAILLDGRDHCGGGIIHDQFILTAAHCIIATNGALYNKSISIIAGTNDLNNILPPAAIVLVSKVYVSAEFRRDLYNIGDIAVLKLKHSLELSKNSNLQKLELPAKNDNYNGKKARISGFGWQWADLKDGHQTGGMYDSSLRFATVDVIGTCSNRTKHLHFDRQMCARVRQRLFHVKGVCLGDSGGPLVYKRKTVIGVLTVGPKGCSEKTVGALYTRVSSYLDFIQNAIKDKIVNMRTFDIQQPSDVPDTIKWQIN